MLTLLFGLACLVGCGGGGGGDGGLPPGGGDPLPDPPGGGDPLPPPPGTAFPAEFELVHMRYVEPRDVDSAAVRSAGVAAFEPRDTDGVLWSGAINTSGTVVPWVGGYDFDLAGDRTLELKLPTDGETHMLGCLAGDERYGLLATVDQGLPPSISMLLRKGTGVWGLNDLSGDFHMLWVRTNTHYDEVLSGMVRFDGAGECELFVFHRVAEDGTTQFDPPDPLGQPYSYEIQTLDRGQVTLSLGSLGDYHGAVVSEAIEPNNASPSAEAVVLSNGREDGGWPAFMVLIRKIEGPATLWTLRGDYDAITCLMPQYDAPQRRYRTYLEHYFFDIDDYSRVGERITNSGGIVTVGTPVPFTSNYNIEADGRCQIHGFFGTRPLTSGAVSKTGAIAFQYAFGGDPVSMPHWAVLIRR